MIKVELGHMGISFDCELSFDSYNGVWSAYVANLAAKRIKGVGKSPVLAIEDLRNQFHKEED